MLCFMYFCASLNVGEYVCMHMQWSEGECECVGTSAFLCLCDVMFVCVCVSLCVYVGTFVS